MSAPTVPIPTGYKSKLPSTLSWPVGAEEISNAFAGLQQYSQLKMDFLHFSRHNEALRSLSWMTLLKVSYAKRAKYLSASQSMIERGYFDTNWSIEVSAVFREDRKKLHDRLIAELPKISIWLAENHDLKAFGSTARLVVWDKQKDYVYVSGEEKLGPERVLHRKG